MTIHASFTGFGSALPARTITNHELESLYGLNSGWIKKRCGINSRHISQENETASTLGALAAKNAIQAANIQLKKIDTVIVSTCTPDMIAPATACLIAKQLNINGVTAFDVSSACTGWMCATQIANSMIKTQAANNVLIVGTELMSRIVDWKDPDTRILFGDGAGAAVLSANSKPGIISITVSSDNSKGDILYATNAIRGQAKEHASSTLVLENGQAVFKHSVDTMVTALNKEMRQNHLSIDDIDWLVLHQANSRIIDTIAKKIHCPKDKLLKTIEFHGNTSSASVPMVLDHYVKNDTIKPNQTVLLGAFGSGFTWATGVFIS